MQVLSTAAGTHRHRSLVLRGAFQSFQVVNAVRRGDRGEDFPGMKQESVQQWTVKHPTERYNTDYTVRRIQSEKKPRERCGSGTLPRLVR
jgi:hypothetical protein